MRVGLIIYGSLDTISGGYLYDRQLVGYLRGAGDAVEVISIPWRNTARHVSDNFSRHLYHRLLHTSIDVLLQDELNHASLFVLNRRLRGQVAYPLLSIVHHLRCFEAHPRRVKWLYRWLERQYLASVDGFIFNSETTRRAVNAMLRVKRMELARSVVAYPGGDRFTPRLTATAITQRAHETGLLRLLFIGNLIPRKGLHVLLEALLRLPGEMWQLCVVGDPRVDVGYTQKIRRLIASHPLHDVRLAGVLTDEELAQMLAASQVLVVPSDYEGFGIVYLEGMSFGLPAIATTAGAAGEIIADGENGFLVPPNNPNALADRLMILANDRECLAQLSLAAYERFRRHPSWRESMARIREMLCQ